MLRIFLLYTLLLINYIDGHSQCINGDLSIWTDTWKSCIRTLNPINSYGETHWIQYDLGKVRNLSKTWIWNTNDPERLGQGFKEVKVDYSTDGSSWTHWGTKIFAKGTGNAIYRGMPGPDLTNLKARYILFTMVNNFGHPECAGIAEVKFNLLPDHLENAINPPTFEDAHVEMNDQGITFYTSPVSNLFTLKGDFANYSIQVLDAGGSVHQDLSDQSSPLTVDTDDLPEGVYFIKVRNNLSSNLWVEQMIKI